MSSRSSAGALIGDTVTDINTIKWNFGFWGEGKPEFPEKTSRCRVENQQTQPSLTPALGIEPGPHWWEASALTTAPSLHPHVIQVLTVRGFSSDDGNNEEKVTSNRYTFAQLTIPICYNSKMTLSNGLLLCVLLNWIINERIRVLWSNAELSSKLTMLLFDITVLQKIALNCSKMNVTCAAENSS